MTSPTTDYMVYTKPACPNCEKTRAYFEAKGITYTVIDITENPGALEYITAGLGYSQAPVIVNNTDEADHWAGLRMDKLVSATLNTRKVWA